MTKFFWIILFFSVNLVFLISSNGQEIISEKLPFYSGSNLFVLKLEDELQGVYFIEFMVDNKIRRKKIVIM